MVDGRRTAIVPFGTICCEWEGFGAGWWKRLVWLGLDLQIIMWFCAWLHRMGILEVGGLAGDCFPGLWKAHISETKCGAPAMEERPCISTFVRKEFDTASVFACSGSLEVCLMGSGRTIGHLPAIADACFDPIAGDRCL